MRGLDSTPKLPIQKTDLEKNQLPQSRSRGNLIALIAVEFANHYSANSVHFRSGRGETKWEVDAACIVFL